MNPACLDHLQYQQRWNFFSSIIILYESEIWGPNFGTKNLYNLGNKTENIHLHCCKWALNVSRMCSNSGALGELGRYPLLQNIIINVIKYWMHLESLPEDRLLYKVYNIAKQKKLKWFKYVTECLKLINIDIETVSLSDLVSKNKFLKEIKEKLNAHFDTKWTKLITSGPNPKKHNSKLRTYTTFKPNMCFEKYLTSNIALKRRETFTNLRLSEHKLAIESDRKRRIKLKDKMCTQCSIAW